MSDIDKLYNFLNRANENKKRENFDIFMNTLVESLTKDLDDSYAGIAQRSGKQLIMKLW